MTAVARSLFCVKSPRGGREETICASAERILAIADACRDAPAWKPVAKLVPLSIVRDFQPAVPTRFTPAAHVPLEIACVTFWSMTACWRVVAPAQSPE